MTKQCVIDLSFFYPDRPRTVILFGILPGCVVCQNSVFQELELFLTGPSKDYVILFGVLPGCVVHQNSVFQELQWSCNLTYCSISSTIVPFTFVMMILLLLYYL